MEKYKHIDIAKIGIKPEDSSYHEQWRFFGRL